MYFTILSHIPIIIFPLFAYL